MSDAVALPDTNRENRERDAAPDSAPSAPSAPSTPRDERTPNLLTGQALQSELVRAQAAANSAPESQVANASDAASEAPARRRSTRRLGASEAAAGTESAALAEAAPRRRVRKNVESPTPEAAAPMDEAQPPVVRRRGRPPKNVASAPATGSAPATEATSTTASEPAQAPPAEAFAPEASVLEESPRQESSGETPQVLASELAAPRVQAENREARVEPVDAVDRSGQGGAEERPGEIRERGFEPRGENRPVERGFEPRGPENRGSERGSDAQGPRFRGRSEGRPEGRSPEGRSEAREEGRRGEGFSPNGFAARPNFGGERAPSERTGWREEFGPNGIRLTNREIERRDNEARANEGRAPEGQPTEARPLEARPLEARAVEGRAVEGRAIEPRVPEARGFEPRVAPAPRGFDREEGRGRPERIDRSERSERPERGDNRDGRNENRFGRDRNERPERNGRGDNRDGGRDNNRGGRDNNRDGNRDNASHDPRERGLDRIERDALRAKPELDTPALEALSLEELRRIVLEMGEEKAPNLSRDELVQRALELQALAQGVAFKRGLLEILGDGRGFLRCDGYRSSDGDVYVASAQIKRFNLRTGDMVSGQVRPPKGDERHSGLLRVESINGMAPELLKTRIEFEKLTPIFPDERFRLEISQENITARVIDLVSPIGKGQRGLIVAPPKAGKTTLIKSIANSISRNHPESELIVLLIDERPEEVTDISRSVRGEVVASTFDETAENHMRVAEMVFEKAKRMVEQKKDVVVLLDSLTRLSRAANLTVSPSGRTMSGGLDPAAMHKPKKMFGAARNIEEGGSLTILATVLVDTGSRMDEYIFEEFKGTGNMDLVLDRNLFDQRVFPAIDINKSGTRRDDLLMSKEELASTFHLRRTLAQLDNDKSITLLIDRLKNTKTNADFMQIVSRSVKSSPPPTP